MCDLIPIIFYLFILLRLTTLGISGFNEKKLKSEGAVEFGKANTVVLIVGHFAFYLCCVLEGFHNSIFICDDVSLFGGAVMLLSMLILFTVIGTLGKTWTVKLIIAKGSGHVLNTSFLFRVFKHPNYYLSVIPELIGLGIFLHAQYSLVIGLPLYLVPLIIRIRQEEKAMRIYFPEY
jgi:isoprenylcysteine carboxyl methyltransferase (ICMT) family protein YpbQ